MRKPLDLPVMIAKAFAEDTRAYFPEPNVIKRDEIAARSSMASASFRDRARRNSDFTTSAQRTRRLEKQRWKLSSWLPGKSLRRTLPRD